MSDNLTAEAIAEAEVILEEERQAGYAMIRESFVLYVLAHIGIIIAMPEPESTAAWLSVSAIQVALVLHLCRSYIKHLHAIGSHVQRRTFERMFNENAGVTDIVFSDCSMTREQAKALGYRV